MTASKRPEVTCKVSMIQQQHCCPLRSRLLLRKGARSLCWTTLLLANAITLLVSHSRASQTGSVLTC